MVSMKNETELTQAELRRARQKTEIPVTVKASG